MFSQRISPGRIVCCLLVALVTLNPVSTAQERKTAEQHAAELVRLWSAGDTKARRAVLRKVESARATSGRGCSGADFRTD